MLKVYPTSNSQPDATTFTTVTAPDGTFAQLTVERGPTEVRVTSPSKTPWSVEVVGAGGAVAAVEGSVVKAL